MPKGVEQIATASDIRKALRADVIFDAERRYHTAEIIENLEAALNHFRGVFEGLEGPSK
jgi:hypothetical protein